MALGATPTSLLAASPGRLPDLNGDGSRDLVVADATAGTISVLLGSSGGLPPRLASRVSLPGGALSEPVALRVIDGLVDERPHLLVAARGTGEVLDIPISESGALGAPSSVLSGARPVAIDVRASLTADLAADAVVADSSGALRLLVASPSRTVDQRSGAANVAARDGLVVWSQRVGSQRYRLRLADRSGVRYLPASTSRHQLAPRVGRAADGTPVVTYRRCRVKGCTPWVWSVGREPRPPGARSDGARLQRDGPRAVGRSACVHERLEHDRQLSARRPRAVGQHTRSPVPDQRPREPARRPARAARDLVRRQRDLRAPAREPVARTAAHGHEVDGR